MRFFSIIASSLFFIAISLARSDAFSEIVIPDNWREIGTFVESTPKPLPTVEDEETGFIPFSRNYVDPIYKHSRPKKEEVTDRFSITLAKGEYEPFVVALYALEDLHDVRLDIQDVASKNSRIRKNQFEIRKIEYRAILPKGHREREKVFQLKPSILKPGNHVDLKKGETDAFWITLHALKTEIPGDYTGRIVISRQKKPIRILTLEVKVLPFVLKEIPGKTFSALYTPLSPRIEKNARLLMKDMRAHGMTAYSPIAAGWGKPLSFTKSRVPRVENLVDHLQWAKEEGFSEPTILNVQKLIRAGRPGLDASYDKFDESIDLPNLRKVVHFLETHRKKRRWPEIIYLPIDEPGCFTDKAGTKREELAVLLLKTLKELNVRGATTSADLVDNKHKRLPRWKNVVGWWDKIKRYCSVRIYLNGYPEGENSLKNEMKDARSRGHEVMLYENTSTMGTDPRVSRMYFGFYGWMAGVNGITSWTHPTLGRATILDVWADWKERRQARLRYFRDKNWCLPPSTVCWEMVREGIDDAKYLHLFHMLAKQAKRPHAKFSQLTQQLKADIASTKMSGKKPHCDWSGKRFAAYRNRIIQAILELSDLSSNK